MDRLTRFGDRMAEFAVRGGESCTGEFYKDALLNIYGCLLGGIHTDIVDTLASFYEMDAGGGSCYPIGRQEKMPLSSCVAVDALAMASLAFDDIQFGTTLHPAGPVAAAILGVARKKKVTGLEALKAFQIGMEVECRMAVCMLGEKAGAAKGWFPTGITGGIGAASACGFLFGFDAEQMKMTQALAAVRACGNRGTHGSNAARLVHGIAAENGYVSAAMVERGYTCGANALTGENGLILQLAAMPNVEEALEGLREVYLCETTSCKPYPFGFIAFACMDCCEQLNGLLKDSPKELKRIETYVSSGVYLLGGNPRPENDAAAAVSLKYLIQMAMLTPEDRYRSMEEHFRVDKFKDASLEVELFKDEGLQDEQAYMHVIFKDGSSCEIRCDAAIGSREKPMSHYEIRDKFFRLAGRIKTEKEAEDLFERFQKLEQEEDLAKLLVF